VLSTPRFAQIEREMMIERTRDGLTLAAAEGRRGGRPAVISKDMMRVALGRRADGESGVKEEVRRN
jgi:DNA invertase Pin-like site-specific DNA recombinase